PPCLGVDQRFASGLGLRLRIIPGAHLLTAVAKALQLVSELLPLLVGSPELRARCFQRRIRDATLCPHRRLARKQLGKGRFGFAANAALAASCACCAAAIALWIRSTSSAAACASALAASAALSASTHRACSSRASTRRIWSVSLR